MLLPYIHFSTIIKHVRHSFDFLQGSGLPEKYDGGSESLTLLGLVFFLEFLGLGRGGGS